jgi:hypothetical protein
MTKKIWTKTKEIFPTALMSAVIIVILFSFLRFIPSIVANSTSFFATTLTSIFIPDENQNITPNKTVASTTVNTVQKTNEQPAQQNAKVYYGKSDLEIKFIGTGIIDPASKQFFQTSYAGQNDTIGIKFQVKNIGTNITGIWKLRLNMPSRTTPYYDSEYQVSLKPGEGMEYTASFDNPTTQGINVAYITIDPLNDISELVENNNSLTIPIKIDGASYSYNNNYNYGSYNANPSLPYGTLFTWTSMNVNCYANPQTTYPGNMITWYATVSGGNGYYSYFWTGSENLNSNERSVSKTYTSSGVKNATVTITSNGQAITKQCNALVN